jgi:hypothetical protein
MRFFRVDFYCPRREEFKVLNCANCFVSEEDNIYRWEDMSHEFSDEISNYELTVNENIFSIKDRIF